MKRFLPPLLIVAVASLVGIALFEIVLHTVGFSAPIWYRPDTHLGWTLRPGVTALQTKEGRALIESSVSGWRDQDHPLEKPAGVYRIAVLGDSYAEAMQVERGETFWAGLPERLAACGFGGGRRIEVLNFGVSGYGTAQEYLVLESKALQFKPDLVLLQFTNGNDVRNNSQPLEEEKARPFFVLDTDGALRLDDSFASEPSFLSRMSTGHEAFKHLADVSRVVQLLNNARSQTLFQKTVVASAGVEQGLEPLVLAPPRDRVWEDAWQITEKLLAKTNELARRNGAGFMLVTVPYAVQVHPDALVREELQGKLGVTDLFYPDTRLAEFSRRNGIDAVPLAPEMQRLAEARKAYFYGFQESGMGRGHWNAEGHRVAADIISRRLCAMRQ